MIVNLSFSIINHQSSIIYTIPLKAKKASESIPAVTNPMDVS